jgi:hypothetical protein
MGFLEEEDSPVLEVACVVLRRQVGKADEADLCAADPVAWVQVQEGEVLLLRATTTTTKLLTVKALRRVTNHRMARATGVYRPKLLLR